MKRGAPGGRKGKGSGIGREETKRVFEVKEGGKVREEDGDVDVDRTLSRLCRRRSESKAAEDRRSSLAKTSVMGENVV